MEALGEEEKLLLPHHEQQALCTTRLPYRQGRKLTAVKVYTVNDESRHLLIFGVPSLNLRRETKALLSKFGKVQQLTISKKHEAEVFTETLHAVFEKIQSARIAKKMLDTTGFYGGVLHICYAPELESVNDTRQKLELRRRDIFLRLRNLHSEKTQTKLEKGIVEVKPDPALKKSRLNMGEVNVFSLKTDKIVGVTICHMQHSAAGNMIKDWCEPVTVYNVSRNKRKLPSRDKAVIENQFKPCFVSIEAGDEVNSNQSEVKIPKKDMIVDSPTADTGMVTNIDIDKTLNFSTFGKELIRKLPQRPVNVIKFHGTNTKTI